MKEIIMTGYIGTAGTTISLAPWVEILLAYAVIASTIALIGFIYLLTKYE